MFMPDDWRQASTSGGGGWFGAVVGGLWRLRRLRKEKLMMDKMDLR